MKKHSSKGSKVKSTELQRRRRFLVPVAAIVIVLFAGYGIYTLTTSHAASPYAAGVASTGTLANGATTGSDPLASNGTYVKFGGTTTSGSVWQPAEDSDWMWEIGSPLVTTDANLMGTGVTAYNGDTAPGDNPVIYDIDAIENPASTVTALHALGDHVICYIEVGTAGNYAGYSAADEGIPTSYYDQLQAAGDLSSNTLAGYPENFVNITSASAVTILEAMIKQQCSDKSFDGVETDLDETWGGEEGTPVFNGVKTTFTQAQEETFLTTLANYMHSIGISWIAKNLDDEGSASFVSDMQPLAQGMISEECNFNDSCSLLSPFLNAHKWIGNAEYTSDGETQAKFCTSDNTADINGILFNVNLDGGRSPCR